MNAAQLKALAEWWRMLQGRGQFKDAAAIEMEQRLNRMAQEGQRVAGQPSGMELGDIEAKRRFLEAQGRAERKGLREAPPVDLPPERTLQGQLESLEVPTVPGRELEVRPLQAPVTRYPGTLSSYSIPQRCIEAPDIHVDPSGQARIVSDYYDSIVNYRKSKTLGGAKVPPITEEDIARSRNIANLEAFSPVEQATPARYLTPTPEQKFQTTDTQKRAAQLRKALADLKQGRRRLQGRMGLPFNPKIWNRSLIPAGGPTDAFKRMMDRRSR